MRRTLVGFPALAFGLWLAGASPAIAEDAPEGRNLVYSELGGAGLATLNYERAFANANLRVGAGAMGLLGPELVVIPHVLLGSRHQVELGVGVVAVYLPEAGPDDRHDAALVAEAAYRHRFGSGGVVRASVACFDGVVLPGLSFGWSF